MWKFIKRVFYILVIINVLSLVWGRFFNPLITIIQVEGLVKYQKLDRDYISYDEMGDNIKRAVIASEDQNFYKHNGFDFTAIQKAYEDNQKKKKIRRMINMSKKGTGKLILGAGLGAGLALLFAPKKGSELREDLKWFEEM